MKKRNYGIGATLNTVSKSFEKKRALSWTSRVGVGGSVPSMGMEKTSDSGEVMDQNSNT